jgi:hypothetical protein
VSFVVRPQEITIGTHIDAFFPHSVEPSPEAVRKRVVAAFGNLKEDLEAIRVQGRFSPCCGEWWLVSEDGIVSGEGPSGFFITVYPSVVEFTSVERFGAVEQPDLGIHFALRRVFEAVAFEFGARGRLAVVAGGFGDTDKAGQLAIGGAGFAEVCGCLEVVIGAPARSWEALETGAGAWYLSGQAEPFYAPKRLSYVPSTASLAFRFCTS